MDIGIETGYIPKYTIDNGNILADNNPYLMPIKSVPKLLWEVLLNL